MEQIPTLSILNLVYHGKMAAIIVKLLALALTMDLDLVNLVTNLAKPSLGQPGHQPDQT